MNIRNIDVNDENRKSWYQEHYPTKVIVIKSPVPTAYAFHKGTCFRQIKELKEYSPGTYNLWKRKGKLPSYAIEWAQDDVTPIKEENNNFLDSFEV